MSKNLQDIDALFKKSIVDYVEMPSNNVWDNIDKSLNERNLFSLKIKYIALKKYAAILLILIIGSTCYYHAFNKKSFRKTVINTEKISIKESGGKLKDNDPWNAGLKYNKVPSAVHLPILKNTNLDLLEKVVETPQKNDKNISEHTNGQKDRPSIGKNNSSTGIKIIEKLTLENTGNRFEKIRKFSKSAGFLAGEINEDQQVIQSLNGHENNPKKTNSINSTVRQIKNYGAEKLITLVDKIIVKPNHSTFFISSFTSSFLPLPVAAISSNKRITKPFNHRFTAIIYASPETSFDRLEDDKAPNIRNLANINPPRDNRQKIKENEDHTGSFSAGILLDYQLKNNVSIQSGISLVSKYSQTNPKKVFAEMDNDGAIKYKYNCAFGSSFINPKTGAAPMVGDSATAAHTVNKIMYLGIPLNISYHITKGRFQISPTVGTTVNFLIKQGISTGLADVSGAQKQNNTPINGLRPTYFNANLGIDFSYKFKEGIIIMAMPSAALALSSVNQNSTVKSFPNTFGIKAGLKIIL